MSANVNRIPAAALFEMERVVKAPLEDVWNAWSKADQIEHWWGPKGCTIELKRFEFRPGGFFHYAMKFAGATNTWGRFNYRDIVPTKRIVWLNSFSNEACGIARAPFSELCPLEIENTVTFKEHVGGTTMRVQARPFGETAPERQFFDELRTSGSLNEGYGGTFDRLVAHLRWEE
jgi:uncharacterized protein YndB with AHSA1/START domain